MGQETPDPSFAVAFCFVFKGSAAVYMSKGSYTSRFQNSPRPRQASFSTPAGGSYDEAWPALWHCTGRLTPRPSARSASIHTASTICGRMGRCRAGFSPGSGHTGTPRPLIGPTARGLSRLSCTRCTTHDSWQPCVLADVVLEPTLSLDDLRRPPAILVSVVSLSLCSPHPHRCRHASPSRTWP